MSKSRKIRLEGKRILLRTLIREDAQDIQITANDPEIGKYTPIPHPFFLENAYKLIDGSRAMINKGKEIFLGIEFCGNVVGMAGLLNLNRVEQTAEVGYWIGKEYRKQGLAGEALDIILNFGFKQENLQKIWGRVTECNIYSVKLLEKNGFHQTKKYSLAREVDGRLIDDLLYEITFQDYSQRLL